MQPARYYTRAAINRQRFVINQRLMKTPALNTLAVGSIINRRASTTGRARVPNRLTTSTVSRSRVYEYMYIGSYYIRRPLSLYYRDFLRGGENGLIAGIADSERVRRWAGGGNGPREKERSRSTGCSSGAGEPRMMYW